MAAYSSTLWPARLAMTTVSCCLQPGQVGIEEHIHTGILQTDAVEHARRGFRDPGGGISLPLLAGWFPCRKYRPSRETG